MAAATFIQGGIDGEYLIQAASCLHGHWAGLHICCMDVGFSSEVCLNLGNWVKRVIQLADQTPNHSSFACMNCFSHSLPWSFVHLLPGPHLPWHRLLYGLPHWQKTCFSLFSAPHLLLLRGFMSCAEPKDVNVFQVCFLTLLVCLSSSVGKLLSILRHIKQHQWCQFRQSWVQAQCRDTWVSPGNLEEVRSWRNPGREKKNQGGLSRNLGETGAEGDKAANADGQW